PWLVGGAPRQVLAQTVTAGVGGDLVEVRLPVTCPAGDLTLEVRGLAGDLPGDPVRAAWAVAGEALRTPAVGFRAFPLPAPVPLAPGERFALVLRSAGTCEVAASPVGDSYPAGSGYFRDRDLAPGRWVSLGVRADLPFQTVVELGPDDEARAEVRVGCFVEAVAR
ncbi:MAG: hypothetical protein ACYDA8_12790, partial [Deferrisomatales bacterium]